MLRGRETSPDSHFTKGHQRPSHAPAIWLSGGWLSALSNNVSYLLPAEMMLSSHNCKVCSRGRSA